MFHTLHVSEFQKKTPHGIVLRRIAPAASGALLLELHATETPNIPNVGTPQNVRVITARLGAIVEPRGASHRRGEKPHKTCGGRRAGPALVT
jgi:hypothetical protein